MIKRTQGIVFRVIKHRETSIITHVFTPGDGVVSLIASGVRSTKNKGKAARFQPGHILEVLYYDKQREGIMRLKESSMSYHYRTIPGNMIKIAQLQYLVEVTRNSVYPSSIHSEDVYPLLHRELIQLDAKEANDPALAVRYLWTLINRLGLSPNFDQKTKGKFFDLESGEYTKDKPGHGKFMRDDEIEVLRSIEKFQPSAPQRASLMDHGHRWLMYHLSYFKEPRTPGVFREIFG